VTTEPPLQRAGIRGAPIPERYVIFAVLWAVGMLFHTVVFDKIWVYPALWIAALLVLFRPSSLPRFLFLAAAQVHAAFDQAPAYPNHWFLAMCMNASVLLAYVLLAWERRSWAVTLRELFAAFAPVMRVLLLILYFFATFAKLNYGYFDPATSCAVEELRSVLGGFPGLADLPALQWFGIVGSVGTEAAIFVLLLVPRFRVAGIVLGCLFHLMLSMNVYHAFVSILFAQFFLFTPESFPHEGLTSARGALDRLPRLPPQWQGRLPAIGRGVACGAIAVLAVIGENPWLRDSTLAYYRIQRALFYLWAPSLFAFFVLVQVAPPRSRDFAGFGLRIPRAALAVIPLLVVLNGAAPYLGIKTEGSFAMFSNLRTEGGESNHLVVRETLSLAGWDDLVTVEKPMPRRIRRMQERGQHLTFYSLRSRASRRRFRNAPIRYVRFGTEHHVGRIHDDPEIGRPYPFLVRKFVRFRHPESPYGSCQH